MFFDDLHRIHSPINDLYNKDSSFRDQHKKDSPIEGLHNMCSLIDDLLDGDFCICAAHVKSCPVWHTSRLTLLALSAHSGDETALASSHISPKSRNHDLCLCKTLPISLKVCALALTSAPTEQEP